MQEKKKKNGLMKFVLILLSIVCIASAGWYFLGDHLKKQAAAAVEERAVEEALKSAGLEDNEEVQAVLDSVSEEDKDTVTDIIADHLNGQVVGEVTDLIRSQDASGLVDYMENELSDEEKEELGNIVGKYIGNFLN